MDLGDFTRNSGKVHTIITPSLFFGRPNPGRSLTRDGTVVSTRNGWTAPRGPRHVHPCRVSGGFPGQWGFGVGFLGLVFRSATRSIRSADIVSFPHSPKTSWLRGWHHLFGIRTLVLLSGAIHRPRVHPRSLGSNMFEEQFHDFFQKNTFRSLFKEDTP